MKPTVPTERVKCDKTQQDINSGSIGIGVNHGSFAAILHAEWDFFFSLDHLVIRKMAYVLATMVTHDRLYIFLYTHPTHSYQ